MQMYEDGIIINGTDARRNVQRRIPCTFYMIRPLFCHISQECVEFAQ